MTDTWYIAMVDGARKSTGDRREFRPDRRKSRFIRGQLIWAAVHFLKAAGCEVFVPCQKIRTRVRGKLKDVEEPTLGRQYVLFRGQPCWAVLDLPHVHGLLLDADGNPAAIDESEIAHLRESKYEKPKLNPAWRIPEGKLVAITHALYQGLATVVRTSASKRRKGFLVVLPKGAASGSLEVPVSAVEAI